MIKTPQKGQQIKIQELLSYLPYSTKFIHLDNPKYHYELSYDNIFTLIDDKDYKLLLKPLKELKNEELVLLNKMNSNYQQYRFEIDTEDDSLNIITSYEITNINILDLEKIKEFLISRNYDFFNLINRKEAVYSEA